MEVVEEHLYIVPGHPGASERVAERPSDVRDRVARDPSGLMRPGERIGIADEGRVAGEAGEPAEDVRGLGGPPGDVDTERVRGRRGQMRHEDLADVQPREHGVGRDPGRPPLRPDLPVASALQERHERGMPTPIQGGRLDDSRQEDVSSDGLLVDPSYDGRGHQRTSVQRSVYQHELTRAGLRDGPPNLAPLSPLTEGVDRPGEIGESLGILAEVGEGLAREAREALARHGVHPQGRRLDQLGDPPGEANARDAMGRDRERSAVGDETRPAVDGPDDAGIARIDRFDVERIGVPGHDEILAELELPIGDPDVTARPFQEVGHEGRGLVEGAGAHAIRSHQLIGSAGGRAGDGHVRRSIAVASDAASVARRPRSSGPPATRRASSSWRLNRGRGPADNHLKRAVRRDGRQASTLMASNGRYGVARTILIGLVGLLIAGVAGALWLSVRARQSAEDAAVEQARAIASESLGLVLTPSDFDEPVSEILAVQITQDVSAVVLDPSDYTTVTVWSEDGTILYSTDIGSIGNLLAGERQRIRSAIRGEAVTKESGGEFSVMVPLEFRSGIGPDLAVELIRPSADIGGAAGPWRTIALFLLLPLLASGLALYGVGRMKAAIGTITSFPRPEIHRPLPQPQVRAPRTQVEPTRRIEVPTPGLREEGEARRMAEDRARAAEERLALLQDQYKKALDDLQTFQRMAREAVGRPDPQLEERALRAEGLVRTLETQVRALQDERARLATQLDEATSLDQPDPEQERRILQAEQQAVGLRAELEGTHAQLTITKRELTALQDEAARSSRLQVDLDGTQLDLQHQRDALLSARSDLQSARAELEELRTETRVLRREEERATVLDDELRAAKAELASAEASHRAELVEHEAALEEKVRGAREKFQQEIGEIEASYREQLALKESEFAERISAIESESGTVGDGLAAAHTELQQAREEAATQAERLATMTHDFEQRSQELEELRTELGSRDEHATAYLAELDGAKMDLAALQSELVATQETLAGTQAELLAAQSGSTDTAERAARMEDENGALAGRMERMGAELEAAAGENADLHRKLQEIEARRALELADDSGRAEIDDLLRVTQERLAGQTEKLMSAEDRIHDLERDIVSRTEQLDEVGGQLRQHQMSDALREIREPAHDGEPGQAADTQPFEDLRESTPLLNELAVDAKRNLTRIMGITQVLKHKKDGKDHDQLVKQLATLARRLDHAVGDLAEVDALARGTIDLALKRTDLQAMVERVVDESGVGDDHDVRLDTTSVSITVDPQRTEQIISALLRNAGERTPGGKGITVRLAKDEGGALFSVEDPEQSSDGAMSLVVLRFAEVQGGWAKVEDRESGGSAFRVFLPDAAPRAAKSEDDAPIVVEDPADAWESSAAQILVQELHRLAEKD